MIENIEKKMLAYALKNAVEHEGKCQSGAVLNPLFHEGLDKAEVKNIMPKINEVVKKVNSMSLDEQKKELEETEKLISHRKVRAEDELPELPDVPKTGVVMRFAPAPSGALHVGHAISNVISSLYVEKYGGKFYVRIEDTNPEKTDKNAYQTIKEDCDWLFGNVTEYIIQSERLELYYSYAKKLIEKNAAYVCTCSQEDFKLKYADKMQNCPCRDLDNKEQEKRWQKMLDKKGYAEGEAVLRFKSNMQHKNPAMRDFPLARISLKEHPKQGTKYRVWPLMNLSVSVDDMELGMTHVIRGKDHHDNAERQKMIFEIFNKPYPWTFFMGRIKFSDLKLGKRHIKAAIESGEFSGWEDEKLPTLVSLRKRGFNPIAFKKFSIQRGLTSVDKVMDSKEFFAILERFSKE
ncbi:Glutamate--tRNA ligase [uncultured archaeon]|nr:Glutamate--tRNA ligase [uncultured archaeon]